MTPLFLANVVHHDGVTNVRIDGNTFTDIGPDIAPQPGDYCLDVHGRQAILPPFYNAHTHAAMTLFRGFAEDMELDTWLQDHIWPAEAKLTAEDVYAGSRLAILEMIKSGTVYFNDMYWEQPATAEAVESMGVRADLGLLYLSLPDGRPNPRSERSNAALLEREPDLSDRVRITLAPHSIYTVSQEKLSEIAEQVQHTGRYLHIHVSETAGEVENCQKTHGMSPVAYLDKLGLITSKSVLAHCVHIDDHDRRIIAERGAVIAHAPISNLKLRSGFFSWEEAIASGCRAMLSTDGASSNNSLSMFDDMKVASLLAKSRDASPYSGSSSSVWTAATSPELIGIDAGRIEVGKLADAILVNLDHPAMVGDYDLIANMVFSADPSVIDTVICDGSLLMENRVVAGEDEIIAEAREVCSKFRRP